MNDKTKAHMALVDEYGNACSDDPKYYKTGRMEHEVRAAIEASAIALQAEQAGPGFVMVPVEVLERAAESLGSFVSDHGWSGQDMQNMDNLDAFIARHKANLAARPSEPPNPAIQHLPSDDSEGGLA